MDLVQTIRKEGSRGGRTDFKWEDVKTSVHRENYLGHSLMAPVGRWQKNRDVSWYAKAEGEGEQMSEADMRREEIKRVKRAEEEAMAKALGYELPEETNANMTALGAREVAVPTEVPNEHKERRRHRDDREGHRRRERSTDDRDRRHRRHASRDRERRHSHRHRSPRDPRSRSRSRSRDRRGPRSHDDNWSEQRQTDRHDSRRRDSDRGARRSRSPDRPRR